MKQLFAFLFVALLFVGTYDVWAQGDVGSAECGDAQAACYEAIALPAEFKNHGKEVSACAKASNGKAGFDITDECHSCIVSQVAQSVPIIEQESCGQADPCEEFEEECPCDYNTYPKTSSCWPANSGAGGPMWFVGTYLPPDPRPGIDCVLTSEHGTPGFDTFTVIGAEARAGAEDNICYTLTGRDALTACTLPREDINERKIGLSDVEVASCNCRLEQYTKELIQAGIEVKGSNGGTLRPDDISCALPM